MMAAVVVVFTGGSDGNNGFCYSRGSYSANWNDGRLGYGYTSIQEVGGANETTSVEMASALCGGISSRILVQPVWSVAIGDAVCIAPILASDNADNVCWQNQTRRLIQAEISASTPTPIPMPMVIASASAPSLDNGYASLICSYPWPCEEAIAVVYGTSNCPNGESGGDALAYNAGNYGLFQVNCSAHASRVDGDCSLLLIPEVNVRVAYNIYIDNSGWSPWACRP